MSDNNNNNNIDNSLAKHAPWILTLIHLICGGFGFFVKIGSAEERINSLKEEMQTMSRDYRDSQPISREQDTKIDNNSREISIVGTKVQGLVEDVSEIKQGQKDLAKSVNDGFNEMRQTNRLIDYDKRERERYTRENKD